MQKQHIQLGKDQIVDKLDVLLFQLVRRHRIENVPTDQFHVLAIDVVFNVVETHLTGYDTTIDTCLQICTNELIASHRTLVGHDKFRVHAAYVFLKIGQVRIVDILTGIVEQIFTIDIQGIRIRMNRELIHVAEHFQIVCAHLPLNSPLWEGLYSYVSLPIGSEVGSSGLT